MNRQPGELEPGMAADLSAVVSEEMTAHRYANEGVHVLATPHLVWMCESASVRAIQDALRPGDATVGTLIHLRHEAATPLGGRVTVVSRLLKVDGRRLTFEVEAHDERRRVAAGIHERVVVNLERFLERVQNKNAPPA